jgi:hypothetical protein
MEKILSPSDQEKNRQKIGEKKKDTSLIEKHERGRRNIIAIG